MKKVNKTQMKISKMKIKMSKKEYLTVLWSQDFILKDSKGRQRSKLILIYQLKNVKF